MAASFTVYPTERRRNRTIYVIGYLTFGVVAIRELTFRAGEGSFLAAVAVLAAILLLMATDPFFFRRLPSFRYLYFVLQTALIQSLGLLPPYEDVWGVLYIFVTVQGLYYLSIGAALAWGGLSALLMTATLGFTAGLTYGLGLSLTYTAGCVLVASWEVLSAQAETARRASQALLAELQQANQQLEDYAAQAEAQAAAREREHLAHELHDSVSQTIFGITLAAESARLQLDRDPSAVPELLDRLQDMTSGALGQMRSLIAEWRPR